MGKYDTECKYLIDMYYDNDNQSALIRVYKETRALLEKGRYIDDRMAEGTVLYSEPFSVADVPARFNTVINVKREDSLIVARLLHLKGLNVAVLNMASEAVAGGGCREGIIAQEESMCRRTSLVMSLEKFSTRPPLFDRRIEPNYGGIFSPHVTVFRSPERTDCVILKDPFNVSFISVPAVNNPALTGPGRMRPELQEIARNKIRTIMRIAISNGCDALVLGAWGCGSYRNPPAQIASLFHEIFDEAEFKNKVAEISFAILEDRNSWERTNPKGNLQPFIEEFEKAIIDKPF